MISFRSLALRLALAIAALSATGMGVFWFASHQLDPDHQLVTPTIAMTLTSLAIFAVVGYGFRRQFERIERLAEDAAAIADNRSRTRLRTDGLPAPVLGLAESLNTMIDQLDHASMQQRRFVSDASHELKSPVTAILSNAELALSSNSASEQELRESLSIAKRNAERLAVLVEQLLALAVLDEQEAKGFRRVDLDDVVGAAVAERRGGAVELVAEVHSIDVLGDETQIAWAVGNVLDNGIRHARGRVVVQLHSDDLGAIVSVDDDGPGIPPEERKQLTERFATGTGNGGAGLGLSIAKAATERHGGWTWITHSALGGARVELGFAFDGEHMD